MTLRQRKKEQTRRQIIGAATALFHRRGYHDTTMEEIAATAQVSVGTLYNYFGSKGALLLAIIEAETDEALRHGEALIAEPAGDLKDAVTALFDVYLDGLLHLDRRIIGEALHESLGGAGFADTELGREFVSLDLQFMEQTGRLLSAHREALSDEVPVEEAVMLLYSLLVTQLFLYVGIAGMTPEAARNSLARQVTAAFAGLAPETKA
jgi:AcrR family transcriptional regulator